MVNQKKISATETKLIPRQSPQNPPKPEMKSNQVIFGDLSNSENGDNQFISPYTVSSPKKRFIMAISFS